MTNETINEPIATVLIDGRQIDVRYRALTRYRQIYPGIDERKARHNLIQSLTARGRIGTAPHWLRPDSPLRAATEWIYLLPTIALPIRQRDGREEAYTTVVARKRRKARTG